MEQQEDQRHFLQCLENPARAAALQLLIKTLTDKDSHPYGISIASCIASQLQHLDTDVNIKLDNFENRYKEAITEANDNQTQIGWHLILRGFMGTSWTHLASMKPIDDGKPDTQRGNHRIHNTLEALHTYTRAIWLGRNEVLHKHKDTASAKKFSAESTEIRHYFSDP
jgi:hypothetical protein